ncbi:hypothetical protein HELRODRAFT_185381 [Helobdella robusta]|uniref:Alpha N-terminal protein methyltransferase 1 n=1 Tax=Helobdella robusta TaxID=6412 RepID=T1FMQ9_HELRO|nr:hypothetical protein HELRODRAFT_185381 [Helobdella robusta]ESO08956.1 hypothetical protein HELRODRAFT_185381 [Helobdella robusta]
MSDSNLLWCDLANFYENGKKYWDSVPATVDGMLGGLSHVSSVDIGESIKFLKQFIQSPVSKTNTNYALDCGAGIGRVTKRLLLPLFKQVDMLELCQHFLDQAPEYIGDEMSRVPNCICSGLQDFQPEPYKYDVIWCQWVLGHLTDDDLVSFFQKCRLALTADGLIIFKENVSMNAEFDKLDSSYVRTRENYLGLVEQAGLSVIKETKQKCFPCDLFEVRMFAIK